MNIRTAATDDIAPILDFWASAADGRSHTDDEAGVARLLQRDGAALLIADDGGAIVGTVIAGWDGWRCHVYRLAVAPDRRREGIARRLIDAAQNRFAALGGRRADAMVNDANTSAHPAWDALGYEREAHWSRWVRPL